MSRRKGPPHYVPTLTEVVLPVSWVEPDLIDPTSTAVISSEQQDVIVMRVLQCTGLMIEQRLHTAIEQLIFQHTQAMIAPLLKEIQVVVRESVTQAFDQETSAFPDRQDGLPTIRQ